MNGNIAINNLNKRRVKKINKIKVIKIKVYVATANRMKSATGHGLRVKKLKETPKQCSAAKANFCIDK